MIPTVITEINLQTSKETFETENLSPHQIQEKSRSSKGCLLLLTRSGDATTARYAHEPAGRRATRRATRRVRPRGRERSKRRRRGNDPNPRWKRLSPQTSQRPHHHTPLTFSASFLASPLRSPLAESIHQIEEKKLQTSNRLLGLSASLFSFFFSLRERSSSNKRNLFLLFYFHLIPISSPLPSSAREKKKRKKRRGLATANPRFLRSNCSPEHHQFAALPTTSRLPPPRRVSPPAAPVAIPPELPRAAPWPCRSPEDTVGGLFLARVSPPSPPRETARGTPSC